MSNNISRNKTYSNNSKNRNKKTNKWRNFSTKKLIKRRNKKEVNEAKKINDRLVERALRMKGTSTGEHGIGIGKKDFLKTEKGNSVDIMSQIKKSIDPNNIMNPGKIF